MRNTYPEGLELDAFTRQYLETALWSTTDNMCRCADGQIAELQRHKDRLDNYGRKRMPLGMCEELDAINAKLAELEHDSCGLETGGEPLDANYGVDDCSEAFIKQAVKDCADFQEANAEILAKYDLETAGHDFWLTRNGHGAGFWDGDYNKEDGQELTKASKAYGEIDLYVGDDEKIHSS